MPPKKIVKLNSYISADTDGITLRSRVFDVLNNRVNNNDVVDIIKNYTNDNDTKNDNDSSEIDEYIIKENVELLKDPLVQSVNKYVNTTVVNEESKRTSQSSENVTDDTYESVKRQCSVNINDLYSTQAINKKLNILRYRENVFKAASRLTKESPTYPNWAFKNSNKVDIRTIKINVGGKIFELFENTIFNLVHTKLNKCLRNHDYDETVFIDRDPVCFGAILNFYRTGRLHIPPNVCLTFFEEELLFWGINEEFMEPCCWSDFKTFKHASNRLKIYTEDSEKNQPFNQESDEKISRFRKNLYNTMALGTKSTLSRFMSLVCGTAIIAGIISMILSTIPLGRIDLVTKLMPVYHDNESVSSFLERTKLNKNLSNLEIMILGYFIFDILSRMYLCPDKVKFFSDSLNWVDIVSTLTSIVGSTSIIQMGEGTLEAYIYLLKLPRILRLFRLTESLRSGIGAFVLTLGACLEELKLVFFIIIIMTMMFGALIFSVEMKGPLDQISSVFVGMWWSIVSMAGVGYGDYLPKSKSGYLIGTICILSGVVVCQMPVPIFLRNFSIYYNQASARLISQSHLIMCENVNKSEVQDIEQSIVKVQEFEKQSHKSVFQRFLHYIKQK